MYFRSLQVADISPVVDAMTDAVLRVYPRCRYQPMSPYEYLEAAVSFQTWQNRSINYVQAQ